MEEKGGSSGFWNNFILIGILLSIIYWLLESAIHVFIFLEGTLTQQVFSPDANELWMRFVVAAIIVSFGAYMQASMFKRSQMEESLLHARGLYSTLAESARDAIYVIDKHSKIIYANGFASDISGIPLRELIGKEVKNIFSGKLLETISEREEVIFTEGKPVSSEDFVLLNGKEFYFDTTLVPLKGKRGEVKAFMGISRDITHKKVSEAKLRSEKELAEKYLNMAGVIFLILNPDGTVVMINRKGCEIIGYGAEEIIGKNWFDNFVPDDMREMARNAFFSFIRGDIQLRTEYYENTMIANNGRDERLVAWHNTALTDDKGNITSTLSSGEDITERRKTEDALRQRVDELERFRKATVERELRVKELKDRIAELEGRMPKH